MGQGQVEGSPQIHTSFFFLKLIPRLVPGRGSAGNSGPDNFDEPPSSDPRGPDPCLLPPPFFPTPRSGPSFPDCRIHSPPAHKSGRVVILHSLRVAKGLQDGVGLKKLSL